MQRVSFTNSRPTYCQSRGLRQTNTCAVLSLVQASRCRIDHLTELHVVTPGDFRTPDVDFHLTVVTDQPAATTPGCWSEVAFDACRAWWLVGAALSVR